MATALVFLLMAMAAGAPLVLAAFWMQRGRVGYTLTLFSLLAAGLTLSMYGSTRPLGVDPLNAISAALLVFLPATLGCMAGALLGWLIHRRRSR